MTWQPGTCLNQYQIDRILGRGGFGITYQATHLGLRHRIVIKTINDTLHQDPDYGSYVKFFRKEAQTLAKLAELSHPHIVRVLDLFEAPMEGRSFWQKLRGVDVPQLPCLVMDWIQGKNLLEQVQDNQTPFSEQEALRYIQQAGDALHLVHRAGLVHRDAHPGNIMIRNGSAILIDFGLAGAIKPTVMSSKVGGNPAFVPSDQWRGNRKPNVDIYALGMSLYYALTAELPDPFTAPNAKNPAITDRTNAAILKAIDPDPRNRPQNMAEWFTDLGLDLSSQALQPLPDLSQPRAKTAKTRLANPVPPPPEPSATDYFAQGNVKSDLGNYPGAIEDFDQALRLNPDFAFAYHHRGNVKADLGNYPGAIGDFDQALRLNPNYADAYNNRGNAKAELGNHQAAIEDFDRAIHLNPNYAVAYYNRGNTKADLGNYPGAIEDFDQAIRLNPGFAAAYSNRGNAKSQLGNDRDAIEDFDIAIDLNPNYADAYNNRGLAKQNLGNHPGAIEDFDTAIDLNPDDAVAYYNRGNAKADLGNHPGAIEDFDTAIELNPDDAVAYYNRGLGQYDLGNFSEAIEDYDQAIRLNPNYANAYNNRGNAKAALGNYPGAIEDYDRAIRLNPNFAKAYSNRGIGKKALGQYQAAIEDFDQAIRIEGALNAQEEIWGLGG